MSFEDIIGRIKLSKAVPGLENTFHMNNEHELSKKQITKKKVFHKSLTDVDTPYMSQEPTQPSLPSSLQWENRGAVHPPVAAESAGLVIFHQNGTGGTAGGMGSADHDQPIEEEQARPNPIPGPGIQDKVVEATTPLSSLTYKEQVGKKQRETRLVAQQMQKTERIKKETALQNAKLDAQRVKDVRALLIHHH